MSTPARPLVAAIRPPPRARASRPRPRTRARRTAEDLDLEEDVAPNLGGEDQMQDA